jgi:hypothetical protein
MTVCSINDVELDFTLTSRDYNIIYVENRNEVFFDVFECVVGNEKVLLEQIDKDERGPIVLFEITINNKRYSTNAVLVDSDSTYLEINEDLLYAIREQSNIFEEVVEVEELKPEPESTSNLQYINVKEDFLNGIEEQFEGKISNLKEDISEKLDIFFDKIKNTEQGLVKEKIDELSTELDGKFVELKSDLNEVEEFSKKNINSIVEKKLTDVDKAVSFFFQKLTDEHREKFVDYDSGITEVNSNLRSLEEKIAASNKTIYSKFTDSSKSVEERFNELTALRDQLDIYNKASTKENKELFEFVQEKLDTIDNKFITLTEEENKKYNDLLASVTDKDVVEYKTILKEKIQDVELTNIKEALQEDISESLRGDITSLKRYVEMSSGGGSTAKQFAAGGTMSGNLTVVGDLSARTYLGIDIPPVNGLYLPLSGGNLTGTLSSNNTIVADTILATNLLSATNLDIGFELSGFNVTGDLSASGNLSAADIKGNKIISTGNIELDGDINASNKLIEIDANDIKFTSRHVKSGYGLGVRNQRGNAKGMDCSTGSNTSNLGIFNCSVEAITLDNAGKVGVGTTSPSEALTVNGSISGNNNLTVGNNITTCGDICMLGQAKKLFITNDSCIDFDGDFKITYDGHLKWDNTSAFKTEDRSLHNSAGAEVVNFSSNNVTVNNANLVVSTGNVGIGATTPSEKLTVAGNISATGGLSATDIVIGTNNTATGTQATVAGGCSNIASGLRSTIGGGELNCATGTQATVAGGRSNKAIGNKSAVIGGQNNHACGNYSFTGGGTNNKTTGNCASIIGGTTNLASGNHSIAGGCNSKATGAYSIALGGEALSATSMWSSVGGGITNCASANQSRVGGGCKNTASGGSSIIGGGTCNTASGNYSVIGGGCNNIASGSCAFTGGGYSNCSTGGGTSVVGGTFNNACAGYSSVVGGFFNCAHGSYSSVVGGCFNVATGAYSHVGGGSQNCSIGTRSSVGGGYQVKARGNQSFAGGGTMNEACGVYSFVGAGFLNCAVDNSTAVVGGCLNKACCTESFIGGGYGNTTSSNCAIVVGGKCNVASGSCSIIIGGGYNYATGINSIVVGGGHSTSQSTCLNCAKATHSGILGGKANVIDTSHTCSFIIGTNITSNAACTTFVNNLSSQGILNGNSITSNEGIKVGGDSIISCNASFTPSLSDNGRTLLLDTTSGSIVVTVTPQISGFTTRYIKEAGAAPVVFSTGVGLSGLYSYQDRNQMSIIYSQADILFKADNYAFLGGNLQ